MSPAASPCFLLALLRVALRIRRGAPPPPAEEHEALRLAARAVHFAFYAVILLMPATGALAWFGGVGAMAAVHGAGMLLILVLLALHIAGALYHHFVLKTDVLRRMLRSGKRRRLIILFYFLYWEIREFVGSGRSVATTNHDIL